MVAATATRDDSVGKLAVLQRADARLPERLPWISYQHPRQRMWAIQCHSLLRRGSGSSVWVKIAAAVCGIMVAGMSAQQRVAGGCPSGCSGTVRGGIAETPRCQVVEHVGVTVGPAENIGLEPAPVPVRAARRAISLRGRATRPAAATTTYYRPSCMAPKPDGACATCIAGALIRSAATLASAIDPACAKTIMPTEPGSTRRPSAPTPPSGSARSSQLSAAR